MFELAALFMVLGVIAAVIVALALFGVLVEVIFKLALLPFFLAVGLVKLMVLPFLIVAGLVVALVAGPILLVIGTIFLAPILVVVGLVWALAQVLAVQPMGPATTSGNPVT